MRISDWSSDVCSSDLTVPAALLNAHTTKEGSWGLIHVAEGKLRYRVTDPHRAPPDTILTPDTQPAIPAAPFACRTARTPRRPATQIGRASCRVRVFQSVSLSVVAVFLKKKPNI